MLARLGQHSGFTTKLLANVTPRSASRRFTFGMYLSVSHRWSSVRMNTMFGLPAAEGCFRTASDTPMPPAIRAITRTRPTAIRTRRRRAEGAEVGGEDDMRLAQRQMLPDATPLGAVDG